MDRDLAKFQAVIVPFFSYLPPKWPIIYDIQMPKDTNRVERIYIGRLPYEKVLFNFSEMRIIGPNEAPFIDSADAEVGTAWVHKDSKNIDPVTGCITSLLVAGNQFGSYSYYPRIKKELDQVPDMQYQAAQSNCGMFQMLPAHCKHDVVQYLAATNRTIPFTLSKNAPWVGRSQSEKPFKLTSELAATCRLLNDNVKHIWLLDNVFFFYSPYQLLAFLRTMTPRVSLLLTWPRRIKHIVLNIKTRDADPWYLRNLKHTTIVPLDSSDSEIEESDILNPTLSELLNATSINPISNPSPAPQQPLNREELSTNPELANPTHSLINPQPAKPSISQTKSSSSQSPRSPTTSLTASTSAISLPPASSIACPKPSFRAHLQTRSDSSESIVPLPPQPPPASPTKPNKASTLNWLAAIQRSIFTANRAHNLHSHSESDSSDRHTPAAIASHKNRTAAQDNALWLEGLEVLLDTYRVVRLDVVYDGRDGGDGAGWRYDAEKGEVVAGSEMAGDQVRTFCEPWVEEVLQFVLGVL